MQKRYLPITILTALLFLVAAGGYLIGSKTDGPPVRVLMENKGGKVIFGHADHVESMDQDCGACHHTSGMDPNPPACSQCHAKQFNKAFAARHQNTLDAKQCAACHHAAATIGRFSHDDHINDYTDNCRACHHDASIEAEPQACSNCHLDGSNSVPSLRDAAHARCADCHQDLYDKGVKGCDTCHERKTVSAPEDTPQACSACHTVPVDQLVPNSTNAFHGQCRGCHEKTGSGPFNDASCNQCHLQ